MGRQLTFGGLKDIWSNDDESAELIRRYRPYVELKAREMEQMFPGEDFEAQYMTALYLAVFRRREIKRCSFKFWLKMRLQDQNSNMKARFRRRPSQMRRVPLYTVDDRLSYSESK